MTKKKRRYEAAPRGFDGRIIGSAEIERIMGILDLKHIERALCVRRG